MGDASGEGTLHICTTNTTPPSVLKLNVPHREGTCAPNRRAPTRMGNTGTPWTRDEIWEAVARGPHQSALSPKALAHFAEEVAEKVRTKQAQIVLWDDIKDNPLKQLKISPIAAIPHKSKAFCSILNLSFQL